VAQKKNPGKWFIFRGSDACARGDLNPHALSDTGT
jgi:hypothetical protein